MICPGTRPWIGRLALACLLVGLAPLARAQVVDASLSRDRVYLGAPVTWRLEIETLVGLNPPPAPEVEGLDIRYRGSGTNFQSFNGVARQVLTFEYLVDPQAPGTFTIPGPALEVAGRMHTAPDVTLTVLAPEEQDLVVARTQAVPEEVLPLEPFQVRLQVFVRRIEGLEDADPLEFVPLSRAGRHASLEVPWLVPEEPLTSPGLERYLRDVASRRRSAQHQGRVGFTLNNLTLDTGPFRVFSEPDVFDLSGRRATAEDVAGFPRLEGRADEYWVYTLERRFTAEQTGEYSFGMSRVRGEFLRKVEGRRPFSEDILAVAEGVRVRVTPPPAEGRPASFTGGVGRFQVVADVTPRRAGVGDPLTLTLMVRGQGTLADLVAPDLATVPGFAEAFRIYDATSGSEEGGRTFTWSLRPLHAEVGEVPPIPFTFFDAGRWEYVTVTTDALPLEIEAREVLDESDIVAPGVEAPASSLSQRSEGLFASVMDPRELRHEPLQESLVGGVLAGLGGAWLLGIGALSVRQRRLGDPRRLRRRGAAGRAEGRLAAAGRSVGVEAARQAIDAIRGLLADVYDVAEAGLTGRDAERLLHQGGAPEPLREAVRELLAAGDHLQYGGAAEEAEQVAGRARDLLPGLVRHLRQAGRLS